MTKHLRFLCLGLTFLALLSPAEAHVRGRMFIWLEGELYLLKVVYLGNGAQSLVGLNSQPIESLPLLQTVVGSHGLTDIQLDRQSDRAIENYVASLRKHYLLWAKEKGLYPAGADPEFAQVAWKSWMKSTHFLVLEKHNPAKGRGTVSPALNGQDWRHTATLENEWGYSGEPVAAFAIQSLPPGELTDFEKYFGMTLPRDTPQHSPGGVIPSLFWVPHTHPETRYYGGSVWVHGLFIKKEKVNQFVFQSMLRAAQGLGLFTHSTLIPRGETLQTVDGPVEGPVSVMPSRIYSFCWDHRTTQLHQFHGFSEIPELVGRKPPGVEYLKFLQVPTRELAIETDFLGAQTARSLTRDIFFIDRLIRSHNGVEASWSAEHPLETVAAIQNLLQISDTEFNRQRDQIATLSGEHSAVTRAVLDWMYSSAFQARSSSTHPFHLIRQDVSQLLPGSIVVQTESCLQLVLNHGSLRGFRLLPNGGLHQTQP